MLELCEQPMLLSRISCKVPWLVLYKSCLSDHMNEALGVLTVLTIAKVMLVMTTLPPRRGVCAMQARQAGYVNIPINPQRP